MMDRYEWSEMPSISSSFGYKVEEIELHLDLLRKLLRRNTKVEYMDSGELQTCELSPELTHPFKSGAILMVYNFMESVCTALMNDLYEHIKINISDEILENLNPSLYKTITNYVHRMDLFKEYLPHYFYTQNNLDNLIIVGWLERMLNDIKDSSNPEDPHYKWFNGNVDLLKIRECIIAYGVCGHTLKTLVSGTAWPRSLKFIKNARNKLAHGGATFTEFGRTYGLEEIEEHFRNVKNFFLKLLDLINLFLKEKKYLQNSIQPLDQV